MGRPKEFVGETKAVGSRIPIETYNIVSKGLGRKTDSSFILEEYEEAAEDISRSLTGVMSKDSIRSVFQGNSLETEANDLERKVRVAYENKDTEKLRPLLGITRRIIAMVDTITRVKRSKPNIADRLLEEARTDGLELRKNPLPKPNYTITAIVPVKEVSTMIEVSDTQQVNTSPEDEIQILINKEWSRRPKEPIPRIESEIIDEEDETVRFYSEE